MIVNAVEEAISRLRYIQLDSSFTPGDIVHMILAGGVSQRLYNVENGVHQSALEFFCTKFVKEDADGRLYIQQGESRSAESERENEHLGILAAAGIHFPGTPVLTDAGRDAKLSDVAESAMRSFVHSPKEPSWSLMLFSVYPGATSEWKNQSGELWNVERILKKALSYLPGSGACFGTHLLEGIAFSLSRYCLEMDCEPGQSYGVWNEAWERVRGSADLMKRNQREDGSIDRVWYQKGRFPQSFSEVTEKVTGLMGRKFSLGSAIVYPTGHCLDALSSVAPFLTGDRTWIDSACYIVAQTVESQWPELMGRIPHIAHALHALKLIGE